MLQRRRATMAISFKGAHFPQDIILMGVRWYVAYLGFFAQPLGIGD
jgi:transposase-like protein